MFALSRQLPPRTLKRVPGRAPSNKRFFIQSLCDGFLDLATALPYPPSVPPYATTIILATVASRVALFPIALWGRNRVRRLENVVLPEVERIKPIISKRVLEEMKKEGMPKEMLVPATLQRIHMSRMMQRVKAEQKRLIAQHKCHPILSMAVSPLSQLPVFVVMSIMFNRLAQDPTPFDSEAFFTLTTLNHPDQTWTLPIILGMVTMANVESNNWLMSAYQRERLRKAEEHRQKLAASGQMTIRPQRVVKSVLNVLSVARILLAAISPGSVVLYWTTSATFGLVQTWILDYSPAHRAKTLESVQVQTPVKTAIPEAKAPTAQLKASVTPEKAPSAAEKVHSKPANVSSSKKKSKRS